MKQVKLLKFVELEEYELAEKQLKETGYSLEEVLKIEKAFESAYNGKEKPDYFIGLTAVLNELSEIHQVSIKGFQINEESKSSAISDSIVDSLVNRYETVLNVVAVGN